MSTVVAVGSSANAAWPRKRISMLGRLLCIVVRRSNSSRASSNPTATPTSIPRRVSSATSARSARRALADRRRSTATPAICASWASPNQPPSASASSRTRCRPGAAWVTISWAWTKRSGSLDERRDGGVDLLGGVAAVGHDVTSRSPRRDACAHGVSVPRTSMSPASAPTTSPANVRDRAGARNDQRHRSATARRSPRCRAGRRRARRRCGARRTSGTAQAASSPSAAPLRAEDQRVRRRPPRRARRRRRRRRRTARARAIGPWRRSSRQPKMPIASSAANCVPGVGVEERRR